MVTIIRGGTIVTNKSEYLSDVKIERGTITGIGSIGDIVGAEVINASGSFLFPGFIDPHTHLEIGEGLTGTADNFSTGSKAAIVGGTTTVIDFITQEKGGSLKAALKEWHKKAGEKSYCDYGFHMGIIDWNDSVCDEMSDMMNEGVTSFKMYMAYRNSLQVNDEVIYEGLKKSKEIGGLIGFHCENGDLIEALIKENLLKGNTSPYFHQFARPDVVEEEAVSRLAEIAKLADSRIWVVHLSTARGLEIVNRARKNGADILLETCPQYLVLDSSYYGEPNDSCFEAAKYVLSPPLRDKINQEPLWRGIKTGEIEIYSSDHCSFNYKEQKERGLEDFSKIPNGGPGVEHRIPLMYTYGVCENKMTRSDMVRVGCTNPAEIFGMQSKGSIEVGKDADIVIFNPNKESVISAETQTQNVDYTPYEGFKLKGKIEKVLLRGKTVFDDGKFLEEKNGKYISRTQCKTL